MKSLDRCVVCSLRRVFIRPWIRAYFASGNTLPLVICSGQPDEWSEEDLAYCKAAAEYSGGMIFDCSEEWEEAKSQQERAVRKQLCGWYTKKNILYAVATRLEPKLWLWIDDDAEVTGKLDECFDAAEKSPGFVFTHFYNPSENDVQHPDSLYRSNVDPAWKLAWNSFTIFHGEANERISEQLYKKYSVEDDECILGYLYQTDNVWHNGFCDFSRQYNYQVCCKRIDQIPSEWHGKLIHYTSYARHAEVKHLWALKSTILPKAPFEKEVTMIKTYVQVNQQDPVDAVFVIGTKSHDGNKELRYALRNMDKHCKFIRNVYICGFCPSWVDKSKVIHLQWPDRFKHAKDANIIDKLRHACEHPGIAKKILFCSDDQFQTRECTYEDFEPRYLRQFKPDDDWYEKKHRIWHSRLRKTLLREMKRREAAGLDVNKIYYYQPHMWMAIDRDKFIEYAKWSDYENRDDTIIASGYYNFIDVNAKQNFDHLFIPNNAPQGFDFDNADFSGTTHIGYYDGSYDSAIELLKRMFPDKSRFELPGSEDENTLAKRTADETKQINELSKIETLNTSLMDSSPANERELLKIQSLLSLIKNHSEWSALLGEISRAEELRLLGVAGWRVVWYDIIARWKLDTGDGTDFTPIVGKRSKDAELIIKTYIENQQKSQNASFAKELII